MMFHSLIEPGVLRISFIIESLVLRISRDLILVQVQETIINVLNPINIMYLNNTFHMFQCQSVRKMFIKNKHRENNRKGRKRHESKS